MQIAAAAPPSAQRASAGTGSGAPAGPADDAGTADSFASLLGAPSAAPAAAPAPAPTSAPAPSRPAARTPAKPDANKTREAAGDDTPASPSTAKADDDGDGEAAIDPSLQQWMASLNLPNAQTPPATPVAATTAMTPAATDPQSITSDVPTTTGQAVETQAGQDALADPNANAPLMNAAHAAVVTAQPATRQPAAAGRAGNEAIASAKGGETPTATTAATTTNIPPTLPATAPNNVSAASRADSQVAANSFGHGLAAAQQAASGDAGKPGVADALQKATEKAAGKPVAEPAAQARPVAFDPTLLPAAAAAAAQPTAPAHATSHAAPPTSAPVAVALPLPLTDPQFAGALGVQVSMLARDGVQQAELHLNPAEMGPVSVQIVLEGTQARVDFGADLARTRDVIEHSLPELAAALRDAGFTLSGGGVSQHPSGRGESRDPGAPQSAGDGRGPISERGAADPAPRVRRVVAPGGIDLYA